ncbi:hypothetical protein GNX18_00285 [Microbulbifer sp. SH-1]|uniref:hypothetical protein n=1 Tax=Microbulbifer sp. SH-1 TaxID=2681547 RepID=UPI00140B40A3|nr:hypothetical protein [Microbulbifer sp. SH-1]QIL88382.1 hypothetical protein GNX18_00285 [Microbulbifer sp. SH-1]
MAKPQVQADINSRNVKENAKPIQGETRGEHPRPRSELAAFYTERALALERRKSRIQKKARQLPGQKNTKISD